MDVQFITKHEVRSSVVTLSFVYALIHIRYNCLLELFYMVDYLNYRNDLLTCIIRHNLMISVFLWYPLVDVLTPADILDLLSICWHAYPLLHSCQLGSYLIGNWVVIHRMHNSLSWWMGVWAGPSPQQVKAFFLSGRREAKSYVYWPLHFFVRTYQGTKNCV